MTKQDEYENGLWTKTVHRWSARDSRYRSVSEEGVEPWIVCAAEDGHRQCASQHAQDEEHGIRVLRLRNQQIKQIVFDPTGNTLEVWTDAAVPRSWRRKRKLPHPQAGAVHCLCQHVPAAHAGTGGQCSVTGCGCSLFFQQMPGESLAACRERFMDVYRDADVRKPRVPKRDAR